MAPSGSFSGAIMERPDAVDNPGSADWNHHLGRAPDRPDAIAAREFDCGQIVAARPAAPRCPPSDEHEVADLRPVEDTLVGGHDPSVGRVQRQTELVACANARNGGPGSEYRRVGSQRGRV